jgi:hypothetical protein
MLAEWKLTAETEVLGKTISNGDCPPQIPHALTCDRKRVAVMGSR